MDLFFIILCIVHVAIWLFIVTAFLNKETAYYNLYYIIPIIYIVHMLPFHIINSMKENIYPEEVERTDKIKEMHGILIVPSIFEKVRDDFLSKCFFNPLSPQGLLIFGAITSAWRLKSDCDYVF